MDHGTWYTMEDVQKDLDVVSGYRVANVHDACFVVGQQPPPRRVFDEDDDIELLFGRGTTAQRLKSDDEPGPDLKNISKLLRLVQDFENPPDAANNTEDAIPKSKNNIIVISKLNPSVMEFIPKSATSSSQNATIANSKTIVADVPGAKDVEINKKITGCNESNSSSVKTRYSGSNCSLLDSKNVTKIVSNAKSDGDIRVSEKGKKLSEYDEMAALLKSKISHKSDSFEEKRNSNLAIVKLLKLYAKPESKDIEPVKPLKLYTPQFFETCKASDFVVGDGNTVINHETAVEQTRDFVPSMDEVKSNTAKETDRKVICTEIDTAILENDLKDNKKNNDSSLLYYENDQVDDCVQETTLTSEIADTAIGIAARNMITEDIKQSSPEMEESISKVNNWMSMGEKPLVKPNSPIVYLGPIAYKRKDPVTCKSPSEIADKKISKPSDNAYQPSSYADELLEKFKKQKQMQMEAPVLDMWGKLEEDLKRKDQEIRNRKK